jgi:hypothetical protein
MALFHVHSNRKEMVMTKKPQAKAGQKTSSQPAKTSTSTGSRNVRASGIPDPKAVDETSKKQTNPAPETPETTVRHNPEHVDEKADEQPVPPQVDETGPSVSSRI